MNSFDEAKGLIKYATTLFYKINCSYQKSIEDQEIDVSLKIEIKNFMENIRSALDYVATALHTEYGSHSNKNIYFPYAMNTDSETDFRGKINNKMPGVLNSRPDIINKICEYQYFASSKNYWMPLFMELNNKNKHNKLSDQYKLVEKRLDICVCNIPIISILGNGKVNMINCDLSSDINGKRTTVHIANHEFSLEKQTDIEDHNLQQNYYKIVSFLFKDNNQPVMHLLGDSLVGASKIVNELSNI